MLIPLHSDAPIYHYPITTVGLIVVNVLLFILWPPIETKEGASEYLIGKLEERMQREGLKPEEVSDDLAARWVDEELANLPDEYAHPDWRMLQFGNGLHPVQWVMANFMHADILHLVGNMPFLWALGVVIEGKLGWRRFLLVYLLIGTAGYGLVQLLMLGAAGGNALGASLPIYGVMVLALLWAPLNDLHCVLWFRGPMPIEIPIIWFAFGYIVLQIGFFLLAGMGMGSEALHLIGAVVAVPVGLVMLKANLVDCEDYDAISVWRGRHEMSRDEKMAEKDNSPEQLAKVAKQKQAFLEQIQKLMDEQQDPALARAAHLRMKHRFNDWVLPEPIARRLIALYHERQLMAESLPAMQEYLLSYPPQVTTDVRLLLAQYMIREAERPRQGLHLLDKLDADHLGESQRVARDELVMLAERGKQQVEIEEPCEDW